MSIDALNELADDFAKTKKSFMDRAKEKLTPALLSVFDKHSELVAIGWTQYTPFFNDGDTCEFGVNDLCATTVPEEVEENLYEWEYDGYAGESIKERYKDILPTLRELGSTLNSNSELLEEVFGDHVRVIVTKNGIEVEEYDHD